MIVNPRVGQVVFVDYDGEGFEKLAYVIEVYPVVKRVRVRVIHDHGQMDVWNDFLFDFIASFTGLIMIDWRIGFGSEPV
jgi:hypothetical protein